MERPFNPIRWRYYIRRKGKNKLFNNFWSRQQW